MEVVNSIFIVKRDRKNYYFCKSSEKIFLKDVRFDNHWVEQSVVKLVDAESFQRR